MLDVDLNLKSKGDEMFGWAENLFPICRSLTGQGVRDTLYYFKSLSKKIHTDGRLSELEKCVVLYQMFTYVGNDMYDENIKNYPGKCDREASENFIINNAGVVEYD